MNDLEMLQREKIWPIGAKVSEMLTQLWFLRIKQSKQAKNIFFSIPTPNGTSAALMLFR